MRLLTRAVVFAGIVAFVLQTAWVSFGQRAGPLPTETADLKQLQRERIETLGRLVGILLEQFDLGTGTLDFPQFVRAQSELIDAILAAVEKPDERIALVEEQLVTAKRMLQWTEKRASGGRSSGADALRAKALCLDIKIKLVRERVRLKAQGK